LNAPDIDEHPAHADVADAAPHQPEAGIIQHGIEGDRSAR
jgi:hypothetical protein